MSGIDKSRETGNPFVDGRSWGGMWGNKGRGWQMTAHGHEFSFPVILELDWENSNGCPMLHLNMLNVTDIYTLNE